MRFGHVSWFSLHGAPRGALCVVRLGLKLASRWLAGGGRAGRGALLGVFAKALVALLAIMALVAPGAAAQDLGGDFTPLKKPGDAGKRNLFDALGGGAFAEANPAEDALFAAAKHGADDTAAEGYVEVEIALAEGWHVYALDSGGSATTLALESNDIELIAPFQPNRLPTIKDVPGVGRSEQHSGAVKFTAPVRRVSTAAPADWKARVVLNVTNCSEGEGATCNPIRRELQSKFVGTYAPPSIASHSSEKTVVRGYLFPQTAAPGETVRLVLSLLPEPGSHVYPYAADGPAKGAISKPTILALTETSGLTAQAVAASKPVIEKPGFDPREKVRFYEGPVWFTTPLTVPAGAAAGELKIRGLLGYQNCTDSSCTPPTGAAFEGALMVAASAGDESSPLAYAHLSFTSAGYAAAANALAEQRARAPSAPSASLDINALKPQTENEVKSFSFWYVLALAFVGGLVLNVMPCVLPVIGLKVMAFVQQAGDNRAQVLWLNLWYSAGLLAVFMVLATALSFWNLGWGQQFQHPAFNIVMTAVVFAMALSFIGVWEIPVPGFVGGDSLNKWASKEGPTGAFAKGVLTTLLATPCSGPGLASALAWCQGQPPANVFLVFGAMGLGMASPYLLIGAQPSLLRMLPKPGPWMETFKQFMGFVLLGTVVFMFTFLETTYVVPTIGLLFGLWAACWWIGRTPVTEELPALARAWIVAGVLAGAVGWFAYGGYLGRVFGVDLHGLRGIAEARVDKLVTNRAAEREQQVAAVLAAAEATPQGEKLRWQPFTTQKLESLAGAENTVLVDFTADWCGTCKFLEATVLNTEEVRALVAENGVETLMADWTHREKATEVTQWLQKLGAGAQVPVLAIFPAGKPNEPIVIIGGYTQATLLAKLKEAGPSQSVVARREEAKRVARLSDN